LIYHITNEEKDFQKAILALTDMSEIALDTETTGLDPFISKVLLISAGNEYQQFVFDIAKLTNEMQNLIIRF
jgi:ribonuclease D